MCDIPSVSGEEGALADAIEAALRPYDHLEVLRDGDAVVARTHLGRDQRVVVAGHIDTVPVKDNLPTWRRTTADGTEELWGRGTTDMKGGVAVALHLAAALTAPRWDVTWVFYDHEEVQADLNGLGRLVRVHPEWVTGDLAVLGEPTAAGIEGGLQRHPARRGAPDRAHRALGPRVARRERRAPRRGGARPARRLPGPRGGGRRARLPRGAQRRRHPRRHRVQHDPRRVRRHRQLPLRPVPLRRRRPRHTCGRSSTATR